MARSPWQHLEPWSGSSARRPGLVAQIRATGADVVSTGADPLVDLVAIHRFALALAAHRGLDPDAPGT